MKIINIENEFKRKVSRLYGYGEGAPNILVRHTENVKIEVKEEI
ncbi:MAG: hypothetical protein QXE05_00590 [Nitrososphaeria archaeon]